MRLKKIKLDSEFPGFQVQPQFRGRGGAGKGLVITQGLVAPVESESKILVHRNHKIDAKTESGFPIRGGDPGNAGAGLRNQEVRMEDNTSQGAVGIAALGEGKVKNEK